MKYQNKMIKAMDVTEWDAALAHCGPRAESMASFAARAFRQLREREASVPMVMLPDERQAGQPVRAAIEGSPARPVPIETAAELAALIEAVAAMATASARPVPRDFMREASAACRDAVRVARGKAPLGRPAPAHLLRGAGQ